MGPISDVEAALFRPFCTSDVAPMRGPLRIRRFQTCRRSVIYALFAFVIILFPIGKLYNFGRAGGEQKILDLLLGPTQLDDANPTIVPTTKPQRPDLPRRQLTKFVNPLIGSEDLGHGIASLAKISSAVFAGATIPFGMAKPVADSSTPWQNQAGFHHDDNLLAGISQMHDEGTGASPSLGNFPIWVASCQNTTWSTCPLSWHMRRGRRVGEPVADVGIFAIRLDTGFDVGKSLFTTALRRNDCNETDESLSNYGTR